MNCSMTLAYKSYHIFLSCSVWIKASYSLFSPDRHEIWHYSFKALSPPSALKLSKNAGSYMLQAEGLLFPNGKDPAVCSLQQVLLIDMGVVLGLGTALLHLHRLSILFHAIAISPWPLLLFAGLSPSTIGSTPALNCSVPHRKPQFQSLALGLYISKAMFSNSTCCCAAGMAVYPFQLQISPISCYDMGYFC